MHDHKMRCCDVSWAHSLNAQHANEVPVSLNGHELVAVCALIGYSKDESSRDYPCIMRALSNSIRQIQFALFAEA